MGRNLFPFPCSPLPATYCIFTCCCPISLKGFVRFSRKKGLDKIETKERLKLLNYVIQTVLPDVVNLLIFILKSFRNFIIIKAR